MNVQSCVATISLLLFAYFKWNADSWSWFRGVQRRRAHRHGGRRFSWRAHRPAVADMPAVFGSTARWR